MIQTRHTFATIALSSIENPLWISKTMGHGNSKMVIEKYTTYVANVSGYEDGKRMSDLLEKK